MGVIFLLFYVGLEIRVKDFLSAGRTSILVGFLGAMVPFVLGYAFMAGIVIDELAGVYDLEEKVKYVNEFLLPFFFVMMGSYVDPHLFLDRDSLGLILVITLIAVLSKVLGSALAAWKEGRRVALRTGVCMVPRGEVGIIVAMIGLSEGTVSMPIYSVVISISILTTLVAPPLIKWSFRGK